MISSGYRFPRESFLPIDMHMVRAADVRGVDYVGPGFAGALGALFSPSAEGRGYTASLEDRLRAMARIKKDFSA